MPHKGILLDSWHKVVAVQLPQHSLEGDIETVKRAIEYIGGPVTFVGHSYGGIIITNAAYNNPNVTGLVYIAAFVPDEGQSLSDLVNSANFPKELFLVDEIIGNLRKDVWIGATTCANHRQQQNRYYRRLL